MSPTTTYMPVVLEPASQAFVEATAAPPFLYEMTRDEAGKVLDDVQSAPIDKLPVDGGGMTAAITLMAQERGDVRFVHQSMYYPVTDAAMDTGSYAQFAEGCFLTAKSMAWFWDCYCPDLERRSDPFASPLRADVLRDEGEAYASRLREAGVAVTTVRYDGITPRHLTRHSPGRDLVRSGAKVTT
jgi:hypothetical protein